MKPKSTKRTNAPRMKMIGVWIPDEMAKALDAKAQSSDLTKSQLIRRALKNEIKQPA